MRVRLRVRVGARARVRVRARVRARVGVGVRIRVRVRARFRLGLRVRVGPTCSSAMTVDLPEPDGPQSAQTWPGCTSSARPLHTLNCCAVG